MEVDRLSALPDDLLVQILRRLYLTEAAKTSSLSKRWRFIWTDLPSIRLDETSGETREPDPFEYGVDGALGSRRGGALELLSLEFYYNDFMASKVDAWVELAVKYKVEHLRLGLNFRYGRSYRENETRCHYPLHQSMYSSSWVKQLSMSLCTVAPPTPVEWRSMTEISLENCILPQQQIHNIVLGCPALSRLELMRCRGFNRLEIGGRSFRSLKLTLYDEDDEDDEDGTLLEISAPYMTDLNVRMVLKFATLRLTNVVSLEKVELRLGVFNQDLASLEVITNAYKLFQAICCANVLVLQHETLQVVSRIAGNGWPLPQVKVEHMKLNTYDGDVRNLDGLMLILQSSPFLERLIINSFPYKPSLQERIDELHTSTTNCNLNCNLLHLETVRIVVYVTEAYYCKLSTFNLARTLLERAPILEQMDIVFKSPWGFNPLPISNDLIKKFKALISYPKLSHKAKIVIG